MKIRLSKAIAMLLILLMLAPVVSVAATPKPDKTIVVGSVDPSLGYDEIVNGTTTFLVARRQPVPHKTFCHNVTKSSWKTSRVEASPNVLGSYYDNSTGKYYFDNSTEESSTLSVPDPSGRVTVFSNTIFLNSAWNPKSKGVLHPDGTSQSLLIVKGQATFDVYARYLIVTLYNSKYPNGLQVDYTVVQSSFDKTYDVTTYVAEREVNTVSVVVTTEAGYWTAQSYFSIFTSGTDVYMIMIPDVPTSWVSDMDAVRRGVEAACDVKPLVHSDAWKGLTYLEIVDIAYYSLIVEYPELMRSPGFTGETGTIVVNAHGEVFPIMPGYTWDSWLDTISLSTQTKALTWVQVAGYPFYYYSYGSNAKTEIGSAGLQRYLQRVLGQNHVESWSNQEGIALDLLGGYSNRLWGYGLIDGGLHEGRPLRIEDRSLPTDGDEWTELSLSGWTTLVDGNTLSLDLMSCVGTHSLRCVSGTTVFPRRNRFCRTFAAENFKGGAALKVQYGSGGGSQWDWQVVKLYAPDSNNYFQADLPNDATHAFSPVDMALGPDNQYDEIANPNGDWSAFGNADWTNVQGIEFDIQHKSMMGNLWTWIDGLFFKISTNLADLLDIMGYRFGDAKFIALGLIGFAYPNQNVISGQQVGCYVHNGALASDSDYNKGKYSMAVAAWTKISILASEWTSIYYQDMFGNKYDYGRVRCQVGWSSAVPPQNLNDPWNVVFVTTTMAYLNYSLLLTEANAPLKITRNSPQTQFLFDTTQSTTLVDLSQNSWQNTIAQGIFWTILSVLLTGVTFGTNWVPFAIAIGLGFGQTVTELAFESGSPIPGPDMVDLALSDNSDVELHYPGSGTPYKQFQSFGVTETWLAQTPDGGASETLTFKIGQKGHYELHGQFSFWTEGLLTVQKSIVVEPYLSADSNHQPDTPEPPSGRNITYAGISYTYFAFTDDIEGDDIRYIFDWGDGTQTTTGFYESGYIASTSRKWNQPGPYLVRIQAQDSQGAFTTLSNSLSVAVYGMGDCDPSHDGKVNIFDVVKVAIAFGSAVPPASIDVDIIPDNVINIFDIVRIALVFGSNYPYPPGFGASPGSRKSDLTDGQTATVSLNPSSINVTKGQTFSVNVTLTDAADLYGWEFQLYWNNTVLNLTSAQVVNPTCWGEDTFELGSGIENGFNSTSGRYSKALSALDPAPSYNESLTLATLTFEALNTGTTQLHLEGVELSDSQASSISHVDIDGVITVTPKTLYMRSDQHTINNATMYKLMETYTQNSKSTNMSTTDPENEAVCCWGIRVWRRSANGTEVELTSGSPVAVVSRSTSGQGLQSATWNCPATSLNPTDSVVVRVYYKFDFQSSYTLSSQFTTVQLNATSLTGQTWTFYYYTSRSYNSQQHKTCMYYRWDDTYLSRIENLDYT